MILLFLNFVLLLKGCPVFDVDCQLGAKISFQVNQTCLASSFPHLKVSDFKFGSCSVGSNTTNLIMDASCIDKSGIDPIVYNGTMETSVQYNTNDMMVHNDFPPQVVTCQYTMSGSVVNILTPIVQAPDELKILQQDDMNEINKIVLDVTYDITADGSTVTDPVALGSEIKIEFDSSDSFHIHQCKAMNSADGSGIAYKELVLVDNGCVPRNVTVDEWEIISPSISDIDKTFKVLTFNQFAFVKPPSGRSHTTTITSITTTTTTSTTKTTTTSTITTTSTPQKELVFFLECTFKSGSNTNSCLRRSVTPDTKEVIRLEVELEDLESYEYHDGIVTLQPESKRTNASSSTARSIFSVWIALGCSRP